MIRRNIWFIFAFATIILTACNAGAHTELDSQKMKVLLWDLSKAEAFHTYYLVRDSARNADSATKAVYAKIFALHKVSADDFFYTLDIYRNDPMRYRVLMDSVNTYGSKQRELLFAPAETTTDTAAPAPPPQKKRRSANE